MGEPEAPSGKGFEISVERDYVLVRAYPGQVVGDEQVLAMLEEAFGLEVYRRGRAAALWDFRGCGTDLHYDAMERISKFVGSSYEPDWTNRFTAIVADAEALYGMARMYEALIDLLPIEMKVFRAIEPARAWLKAAVLAAAAERRGRG